MDTKTFLTAKQYFAIDRCSLKTILDNMSYLIFCRPSIVMCQPEQDSVAVLNNGFSCIAQIQRCLSSLFPMSSNLSHDNMVKKSIAN